jgi:hypothetical protein
MLVIFDYPGSAALLLKSLCTGILKQIDELVAILFALPPKNKPKEVGDTVQAVGEPSLIRIEPKILAQGLALVFPLAIGESNNPIASLSLPQSRKLKCNSGGNRRAN